MSLTILIHSSKTMRAAAGSVNRTTPQLLSKAKKLANYLKTLDVNQVQSTMGISEPLARKVHDAAAVWSSAPGRQSLAMDSFVGDIYSGLQAGTLSQADREYAQDTLRILSGLYGILRPYDGVSPYRLEMGYKLPHEPFGNLYTYWGKDIANMLPAEGLIVNLSAVEYTKTVMPYIDSARVVTPRFLTLNPKTGKPGQVIVHTKIARGAYARWLVVNRISQVGQMTQFADLNYQYEASLSTASQPTFVCSAFGGLGLSVRLQKS